MNCILVMSILILDLTVLILIICNNCQYDLGKVNDWVNDRSDVTVVRNNIEEKVQNSFSCIDELNHLWATKMNIFTDSLQFQVPRIYGDEKKKDERSFKEYFKKYWEFKLKNYKLFWDYFNKSLVSIDIA